jgi:hypothetical protein
MAQSTTETNAYLWQTRWLSMRGTAWAYQGSHLGQPTRVENRA